MDEKTIEGTAPSMKAVTRRTLLRFSMAAGAGLLIAGTAATPLALAQKPKNSILVNVSNCIACMKCVAACEVYHREHYGLSKEGTAYTKITIHENALPVPQLCLHCVDSPCSSACITHAITQLDDGPVIYDRDKCIGCLLCVNQCPFQSITFDPIEKKIYKCDMCHKITAKGQEPNCVKICPTKTRSFGLYDDKVKEGTKLAEQKAGVLLYAGDASTLYALTDKEFERLVNSSDVTVVKNGYPNGSKFVAGVLKYSRLAWAPIALGAAFYVLKWTKSRPKKASER